MSSKKSAALGFIFITILLDVIGLGIIIPVMPKLIMEVTGDSLSVAAKDGGWLLFAYAFCQFIFAPIIGGLSDQYGRRPVLLAALLGFAINYLFLAFAPTMFWLFVGRIVAGMLGASFSTASAYIADISTPEKRSQNFGLVGAAFGLGFIIGPVIGGLLGQYGTRVPFLVAAGLSAINWLYGYFILPESHPVENRRPFDLKKANPVGSLLFLKRYPVIMGVIVSLVCLYMAGHAVQGSWSYFVMEKFSWDERDVGVSLGVLGLLSIGVQAGLMRIVLPKLGSYKSVLIGLALTSIGFLFFAFARTSTELYLSMLPYILGGIAGPSLQGLISTQVSSSEQGQLQGALTSLMSATSIIGPPLMTNVFAYFTNAQTTIYFPGAPMLLGAIFTIIAAFMAWRNGPSKLTP